MSSIIGSTPIDLPLLNQKENVMNIVKALEIMIDNTAVYGENFDGRNEALETIMHRCGVVFVYIDKRNSPYRELVEKSELSQGEPFHTKL